MKKKLVVYFPLGTDYWRPVDENQTLLRNYLSFAMRQHVQAPIFEGDKINDDKKTVIWADINVSKLFSYFTLYMNVCFAR